jgi:hypothetical protein
VTQLLGEIDPPAVHDEIVHGIQNVFDGNLVWGQDVMRLTPAFARVTAIESRQD